MSWRCLVGNGEAAARVLGLFCLINRGDSEVLGANELACGGVQRGVVLAGALTRCDFERRGEHGPVQALGCAVLVENLGECLRLGLVIFREAFAINEAVAVAVLKEASATNDQPPTSVKSGPCTVLQSSAEASNAGTVVEAAIAGTAQSAPRVRLRRVTERAPVVCASEELLDTVTDFSLSFGSIKVLFDT